MIRMARLGMRSQNVQNTGGWARLALRPGASLSALAADRHRDSDAAHQSSLSPTSDGRLQRSQERSENGIHPGGTGPTTRTVPQPIPPGSPPPTARPQPVRPLHAATIAPPAAAGRAAASVGARTGSSSSHDSYSADGEPSYTSTTRARGPSPRRCQRRTWRRS